MALLADQTNLCCRGAAMGTVRNRKLMQECFFCEELTAGSVEISVGQSLGNTFADQHLRFKFGHSQLAGKSIDFNSAMAVQQRRNVPQLLDSLEHEPENSAHESEHGTDNKNDFAWQPQPQYETQQRRDN